MFDPRLLQRKNSSSRRAIFTWPVRAGGFLRATSAYTTGKVSWLGKVLAQHIPYPTCQLAGGSHPATSFHGDGRGASGMGSFWGKQKVWLTGSADKYHPRPQTDKSVRDDVTGIRPPSRTHAPSQPASSLLCLSSGSLLRGWYRQDLTRPVTADLSVDNVRSAFIHLADWTSWSPLPC